jgi:hypothetical protein
MAPGKDDFSSIGQGQEKAKVSDQQITLGRNELQQIISAAVTAAVGAANEKATDVMSKGMEELAHALIESKKPYIDPRSVENDKAMRNSMRIVNERMKAQIIASQKVCPHLMGCNDLSEIPSSLSSFVRHRLDTGVVVAICTNCQLQIFSDDPNPEVRKLFQMKSGNKMSQAGIRTFSDPSAVMAAGRL